MNSLALFIIIFFGIILVIALFILTFLLGKKTIKNNPKNALVLVQHGNEVIPYKGKMIEKPSKEGTQYNYLDKVVFVPARYKENYCKNKRILFINRLGQLIASPFNKDIALASDEREALIYEMVTSHIGSDGMKALKGKQGMNILVIAIIAFVVGIVAVFGYNYMKDMIQPNTTNPPAVEQELPPIGEK